MATRGKAYGDLAERTAKLDSKYDPAVEKLQIPFLERLSGEKFSGSFHDWLKSGVVLCKAMNSLQPGACKNIHTGSMAFKQMENISQFTAALPSVGIRTEDAFQTADLFEGTNMYSVQVCIENLRRAHEAKAAGKPLPKVVTPSKVELPKGSTAFGAAPADTRRAGVENKAKYAGAKDDAAYGDLAERMARLDSKYNPALEKELRGWIESKTGLSLDSDFHAALKDGTVLCALANALDPGSIKKVNKSGLAFKQMENINSFLDYAGRRGVQANDLFQTVSLYEAQNMTQVLQTLDNLKRLTS
eukprot:TRINITY_DN9780_c0_g1_i2.p2 TRINITY_DN9780_c0_g1~~TRINITY_DN9780_c0_g1_i2.p2  ORF type:complete len:302 (+),score=102.17 TRINITY_DN9780_c0_g1_i2:189-1094(+)